MCVRRVFYAHFRRRNASMTLFMSSMTLFILSKSEFPRTRAHLFSYLTRLPSCFFLFDQIWLAYPPLFHPWPTHPPTLPTHPPTHPPTLYIYVSQWSGGWAISWSGGWAINWSVAILARAIGAQGVRPNSALQFAAGGGMTQSFASTKIYSTRSQYDTIFSQFNFDFAGAGWATQTRPPPTRPTHLEPKWFEATWLRTPT
jgi:hypothetical protein